MIKQRNETEPRSLDSSNTVLELGKTFEPSDSELSQQFHTGSQFSAQTQSACIRWNFTHIQRATVTSEHFKPSNCGTSMRQWGEGDRVLKRENQSYPCSRPWRPKGLFDFKMQLYPRTIWVSRWECKVLLENVTTASGVYCETVIEIIQARYMACCVNREAVKLFMFRPLPGL
jgi:hypothetical protein